MVHNDNFASVREKKLQKKDTITLLLPSHYSAL